MGIIEKIERAIGANGGKKTIEQFIRETEEQIAELERRRTVMAQNIERGILGRGGEREIEATDSKIQGLRDKITFARERERMGAE